MTGLNESDFKLEHRGNHSHDLYNAKFGDFWIRVWIGHSSQTKPKTKGLPLSDYTHFEVSINYSEDNGSFGGELDDNEYVAFLTTYDIAKYWNNYASDVGKSRCVYLPVENLLNVIEILKGNSVSTTAASVAVPAKKQEAKCNFCGRMNDIGVDVCWHCCKKILETNAAGKVVVKNGVAR
jgi:hypothetical protein